MKSIRKGFDRIAPYYDRLASFVFGNTLLSAQGVYLHYLNPECRILLLGGGTGKIFQKLGDLNIPLKITYIDISPRMIDMAKKNNVFEKLNVNYICGGPEDIPESDVYDFVLTFFFLDCFTDSRLKEFLPLVRDRLSPQGKWLISDFFTTDKRVHHLVVKCMYLFFQWMCNLPTGKLPNYDSHFKRMKLHPPSEVKKYVGGLIEARIYSVIPQT